MAADVSGTGPVFLRWRDGAAPEPVVDRFETLDAALDAVEARWPELRHRAPQILDRRRVLVLSTDELRSMMAPEEQ